MDQASAGSLRRLAVAFGLFWVCVAMLSAPGPAAWVELSGDDGQAGAYFALFSLSGAAGALAGGRAMDRWGRRPVLVAAQVLAAGGFALAGAGVAQGSLALFALAAVLAAGSAGTLALTRLAAAELVPPGERARAMARVQVSATAGAVLGPLLLVLAPLLGRLTQHDPDTLVWLLAPPLLLLGAAATLGARALRGPAPRAPVVAGASEPIPPRAFAVGLLALVCAQGAMVTVMGVTGVELHATGHDGIPTALVMALHFVGMFGLSLVVGRITDRAGRARTILGGLAILAAGGGIVAAVPGPLALGAGLLLVGLGWSFAYIAGSVLLADVVPASRRARTMGIVDSSTALLAAAASFAGGLWYEAQGIRGLGLAAIALVALPAVAALALRETRPESHATP